MLGNSQMADKFRLTQRVNLVLLVVNVIGACIYVVGASHGWAIPEEHCAIPVTGEPFVWFVYVAPVFAVFTLVNLTWTALIVRYRQWQRGGLWLLAALVWLVAIAIDFAHHC
jgi:hypothetical protein